MSAPLPSPRPEHGTTMEYIDKQPFGVTPEGAAADLYVLANGRGLEARITNYGGIVTALYMPDRRGRVRDITLGHYHLAGYASNKPYLGALIGRFANRIAGGRFTLDGRTYQLSINDGPNSLHGGVTGFDRVLWDARPTDDPDGPALELRYRSRDGEEGYPGNLDVTVVYTLTRAGSLRIRYLARTDRPTPLNLTNHAYFNLGATPDILAHEARINAARYLPSDGDLIPTGEIVPVAGTALDFRAPARIGDRVDDPSLKLARGIDHCFVIAREHGDVDAEGLATAAEIYDRASGRAMRVRTTEPAIQFYSGNFLDGTVVGKEGRAYGPRAGLCLEAQHYPDSPNQPDFPSTILRPGADYRQTTVYEFKVL